MVDQEHNVVTADGLPKSARLDDFPEQASNVRLFIEDSGISRLSMIAETGPRFFVQKGPL
ncbi:hypothetical protein [Nitratireductor thuwali]|uniref:hypothetical protein n=1 Tax=Nitratireductor thuwali TaxID=2267699 RepID=UPI0030CC9E69